MVTVTSEHGWDRPEVGKDEDKWGEYLNNTIDDLDVAVVLKDTKANRPAAGTQDRWFLATDEPAIYWDDGNSWQKVGGVDMDGETVDGEYFHGHVGGPGDPTYAWQADANTGLYNVSDGIIGVSTNGSLAFQFSGIDFEDGAGNVIFDGSNTHVPLSILEATDVTVTAGDGLKGGGSPTLGGSGVTVNVEPADFAGSGLQDDGADNLALSADTVTVAGNAVSLGGSTGVSYADLSDTAASFPIPNADLVNSGVTVAGNAVSLGGTTAIAHSDLSSISADQHHVEKTTGSGLTGTDTFALDESYGATWTSTQTFSGQDAITITEADGVDNTGAIRFKSTNYDDAYWDYYQAGFRIKNETTGDVIWRANMNNGVVAIESGNLTDGNTTIWDRANARVGTDGVDATSIDLSISPTWTSEHTFDGGMGLEDDDYLYLGNNNNWGIAYDSGAGILKFTHDPDGSATGPSTVFQFPDPSVAGNRTRINNDVRILNDGGSDTQVYLQAGGSTGDTNLGWRDGDGNVVAGWNYSDSADRFRLTTFGSSGGTVLSIDPDTTTLRAPAGVAVSEDLYNPADGTRIWHHGNQHVPASSVQSTGLNADSVDGWDIQKNGTDGAGVINFKT